MLRILLNILWFIFGGGFLIWLSDALVGVLPCISIVGIPFGLTIGRTSAVSRLA